MTQAKNAAGEVPVYLLAVFLLLLTALAATPSSAQDTPTEYSFDFEGVDLCTDAACSAPVDFGCAPKTFNLGSAQVAPNQPGGAPACLPALPINTLFTHFRIRLNRFFQIRANAAGGSNTMDALGNDFCNTSTGAAVVNPSNSAGGIATVTSTGPVATQSFTVDDAAIAAQPTASLDGNTMIFTLQLQTPIDTDAGAPSLNIFFTVGNTMLFDTTGLGGTSNCRALFSTPSITLISQ